MAKAKLTPEQWAEARREWESNASASYATVAAKFMISRALVGQKSLAEHWQRDIGVPDPKSAEAVAARAENLQDRPSTGHMDGRLDNAAPARVVAGAFVTPTAAAAPAPSYTDDPTIPDGLDADEREAFIKAAILSRQRAINARHLNETKAVRSQVYGAIKKVDKEGGAGAALAALRIVQALRNMQDSELETELERVRLTLGEFHGKPKGPAPARITVVLEKAGVRQVVEVADAVEGMRLGNGLDMEILDVE